MKTLIHALTAAALTLGATATLAQSTAGEVTKIDKAQQKITLRHGPIASLDMPAMTMVFKVQDATALESLKAGDKVMFDVEKIGGQYTVTKLAPAP
jgi:Cu(I)/Ag(I) efflux system periplasmic protein CusF